MSLDITIKERKEFYCQDCGAAPSLWKGDFCEKSGEVAGWI